MEYLRKYLRRISLMSTLLIGGVLGGLVAPLPSDALTPTLTLQVDTGTPVPLVITTSSTCTPAEVTLGYTHCYAINTSAIVTGAGTTTVRKYYVRNAPNATARLRIADKTGQDMLSLIGMHVVPEIANWGSAEANANELHKLTITMGVTFDAATGSAGKYVWGMRAGGELRAGPSGLTACLGKTTTGACDTVGDVIDFPGKGVFSPSREIDILNPATATTNTRPLKLTVAGPTSPIVSFDGLTEKSLGQVNPSFPQFDCDDNGSAIGGVCKPTITQTMTVTLKGPDSFVLVNGGDTIAGKCDVGLTAEEQKRIDLLASLVKILQAYEARNPNLTWLTKLIERINAFLGATTVQDGTCPGASRVALQFHLLATQDALDFLRHGAVPVEPAPDSTITITKTTSQPTTDIFHFTIVGPYPSTREITRSFEMLGSNSRSLSVTVEPGTYSITEDVVTNWAMTSTSCGSVTAPVGGNVSCTFVNTFSGTAGGASIIGLGDIPGGSFTSYALAVSADGAVVVGVGQGLVHEEPARWTASTGMVSLEPNASAHALAVSGNGSVIVGRIFSPSERAFRWAGAGLVDLGNLPSIPGSILQAGATDVSADGTVVVGGARHTPPGGPDASEAFRWTEATGMVGLGTALPGSSSFGSGASSVSADGSVIVGLVASASGPSELFLWTSSTGMQGLGFQNTLPTAVSANAVSAGTAVIVGYILNSDDSTDAFRWSQETGRELLPGFPGVTGLERGRALDVSGDGSVIVGTAATPSSTGEAVIWRKHPSGTWIIRTLKDVLTDLGVTDATNWTLGIATGITPDGRTIVGIGGRDSGPEAWKIQLP